MNNSNNTTGNNTGSNTGNNTSINNSIHGNNYGSKDGNNTNNTNSGSSNIGIGNRNENIGKNEKRPDSMRSDGGTNSLSSTVLSENEMNDLKRIQNNERERIIFLRAALQLLDECDEDNNPKKTSGENTDKTRSIYNTSDFFRSKSKPTNSSSQNLQINKKSSTRVLREDNIRFGWLKKASKGGTFASVSSLWKAKFVELRHGVFSYEDDFSGKKKVQKKNITLSSDVCFCQVIKMRDKDGDFVFELSMRGGSRRLWQAASLRDRNSWITAINQAMIRSPERFLEPSIPTLNTPNMTMKLLLDQSVSTNQMHTGAYTNTQANSSFSNNNNSYSNNSQNNNFSSNFSSTSQNNSHTSLTSSVGAAAPYADEISRFFSIMLVIKSVESVEHYRDIIDQLRSIHLKITVPVFFVKSQSNAKSFGSSILSSESSSSSEKCTTPRR